MPCCWPQVCGINGSVDMLEGEVAAGSSGIRLDGRFMAGRLCLAVNLCPPPQTSGHAAIEATYYCKLETEESALLWHEFSLRYIKNTSGISPMKANYEMFLLSLGIQCLSWWCQTGLKIVVAQMPQCTNPISHNAPFCNRNVHISVTKWYIVQYLSNTLWDL